MGPELLFVVGLCGLGSWLARRASGRRLRPAGHGLMNLLALLPGDVVVQLHERTDWVVHDGYRLKAGVWRALYRLDGGRARQPVGGQPLLLVAGGGHPDDDAIWLLQPARPLPLTGDTPPGTLEHDGVRHALGGRFRTEAQTLLSGGVRRLLLLCYRGPGDHRLLALRWDGENDAQLLAGRSLPLAAVDILPVKR